MYDLPLSLQVLSYVDVLRGKAEVGRRVAVVGAGGIGFDVSEYLLGEKVLETPAEDRLQDVSSFLKVMSELGFVANILSVIPLFFLFGFFNTTKKAGT